MKMTKTALIASAMLMLSSQVFATDMHQSTQVVETANVATKSAAYELALNELNTLKTDSTAKLNQDLGYIASDSRSLTLDDGAYITVAEKMTESGQVVYEGLVHVNVTYDLMD